MNRVRVLSTPIVLTLVAALAAGCSGAIEPVPPQDVEPTVVSPVVEPPAAGYTDAQAESAPLSMTEPNVYDSLMTCVEQAPTVIGRLRRLEVKVEQTNDKHPRLLNQLLLRIATIRSMALPAEVALDQAQVELTDEVAADAGRIVERCSKASSRAEDVAIEADTGTPNIMPAAFDRMREGSAKAMFDAARDAAQFIRLHGNTPAAERTTV